MLKIGEFAQYGQVSIATLRHYDQFGLLKPAMLDPQTGYRYYSLAQLPRLQRIVTLRELGFSLAQIALLLADDLAFADLQTLFQLKQAHIQQVIALEQERLARVADRLRQIGQEGHMPTYEMLLKKVEPLLVATLRKQIQPGEDLAASYETLASAMRAQGIARARQQLLLWYSPFGVHEDGIYADVELAIPLQRQLPSNQAIEVRTLPGALMACTLIQPEHAFSLGKAHQALHAWLAANAYQLSGPPRQVQFELVESPSPDYALTEIQFPVRRVQA